eukprot:GHVP01070924.1.p2 GENE.GHVP01070924.1~~GHVP01070924.1.p2  ORF type:complete len:117 (-),score=12.87 GHVP01070924.1:26-376(-)
MRSKRFSARQRDESVAICTAESTSTNPSFIRFCACLFEFNANRERIFSPKRVSAEERDPMFLKVKSPVTNRPAEKALVSTVCPMTDWNPSRIRAKRRGRQKWGDAVCCIVSFSWTQ